MTGSPDRLRFLPVGLDVRERACVVVGGGAVGTRKALTLLRAGARVRVVSPEVSEAIAQAISDADPDANSDASAWGHLEWLRSAFRDEHVEGAFLVVAATDDAAVNAGVVEAAARARALVCDASSADRSGLIFGAMLSREDATIAVFTDGRDPGRARRTRDRLAGLLP